MKNYLLLCDKLKELKLDIDSQFSNAIIKEYKNKEEFNNSTNYIKKLSKDSFIFTSSIIEKKIPKKQSNSNHLDYCMQKKYCSYLLINHIDENISIILSNSDSLKEEQLNFSNWIDFFNKNNIDVIFERILNLLETRI